MRPEVRARLMPGVWAVLEGVGEEGGRAVGWGLDNSARAVWRGVWAEWRRSVEGGGRGER